MLNLKAKKLLLFLPLVFCIFFVEQKSFAKEAKMSDKLWHDLSDSNMEYLKKIYNLAEREKYDEALSYAKALGKEIDKSIAVKANPNKESLAQAIVDLVLWKKFSSEINAQNTSFSDISRFAIDNPFFFNISKIRKNVEEVVIENNIPYQSSWQYFKLNPPLTTEGKIYLIDAQVKDISSKDLPESQLEAERKKIQRLIARTWEKEDFSSEEENEFLEKYLTQLTVVDHAARFERLLFDNKITDARRVLKYLNDDYSKLLEAILLIQNSPRDIDRIVASVPRYLRNNEALTYRRINWLRAHDEVDDLIDLLLELPQDSKFAQDWWGLRRLYAREMLKDKEYKTAYNLVAKTGLTPADSSFWEAQWMSGWIVLRFLDKPEIAKQHFEALYNNVRQPVTLARGAYWLGMAAQAEGNKEEAIFWYKNAAKYPTFFYGQLAIHKHRALDPIGVKEDIILPEDPKISDKDIKASSDFRALQIAYLLALLNQKEDSVKIFTWAINNAASEGQIAVIMKISNEFNDRHMDAKLSREAAKNNVFFIKDKFQIIREVANDEYAPLVHAIIKQESGFAPTAISTAGALGFMQLMPATAQLTAREMKMRYSKYKLATDIKYNIKLGSFYIKKLIDRFDGSEMLAIASYNAGPNNTQRWINEFYDPREEKDIDRVVDWIELITYSETRNYVQRIMENMIVYKYLMARKNYDVLK